jgi:YfiH family protein
MKFTFTVFEGFPEIECGMSLRRHGYMNIKPTNNYVFDSLAEGNRTFYLKEEGGNWSNDRVFLPHSIHGNEVHVVDYNTAEETKHVDGAITKDRNTILTVENGDCATIFLAVRNGNGDPIQGIAHSGRVGTEKNIMHSLVIAAENMGCRREGMYVAVGPSIQAHHYPVSREIAMQFGKYIGFTKKSEKGYELDLPGIIRKQAVDDGVPQHHIEVSPLCTFCDDGGNTFFSHRRDKHDPPYTNLSHIVMRVLH